MRTRTDVLLFALLLGALIPLEFVCALLAYETVGETTSGIYLVSIIGLNLLFLAVAFRYRAVAAIAVVGLALLIIPYQVILGDRLLRVQAEVTRLVSSVYEQKFMSGVFPSDLSGYTFSDTEMKTFIQSYQVSQTCEQFTIFYRVGSESTSHWYSSEDGWGYYPD